MGKDFRSESVKNRTPAKPIFEPYRAEAVLSQTHAVPVVETSRYLLSIKRPRKKMATLESENHL